jgi:hypothetical protein
MTDAKHHGLRFWAPVFISAAVVIFGIIYSARVNMKISEMDRRLTVELERARTPPPHKSEIKMVVFSGATPSCKDLVISEVPLQIAPVVAIRNPFDPLEDVHLVVGFDTELDSVRVAFPYDTLQVRISSDRRLADVGIPSLHGGTGEIWIQAFSLGVEDVRWEEEETPGVPHYDWDFSFSISAGTRTVGITNFTVLGCDDTVAAALNPDTSDWVDIPADSTEVIEWMSPPSFEGRD